VSRLPRAGMLAIACIAACGGLAEAQSVEVMPFGGYRFGGDFFEIASGRPVDADGAGSFGLVVNIPFDADVQFEGYFTHQEAHFSAPSSLGAPPLRWQVTVDHVQAGGLSELNTGRARPFLTGAIGLTRYATTGDSEIRFSFSGGGGIKLYASEHAGVRLDGRVTGTLVDADGVVRTCAPGFGVCFGTFHVSLVWQAEFSAGLLVKF
jgi:hypothetical protein